MIILRLIVEGPKVFNFFNSTYLKLNVHLYFFQGYFFNHILLNISPSLEVGVLCVQQDVEDIPHMLSVLLMLLNETTEILRPKLPGFYNVVVGQNEISITSGSSSTSIRYFTSTSHSSDSEW